MQSEGQIQRRIAEADAVWKVFPWKLLSCQHSFEMRYRETGSKRKKKKKEKGGGGCWSHRDATRWGGRGCDCAKVKDEMRQTCAAKLNRAVFLVRIQMSHFHHRPEYNDEKNIITLPRSSTPKVVTNINSLTNWDTYKNVNTSNGPLFVWAETLESKCQI